MENDKAKITVTENGTFVGVDPYEEIVLGGADSQTQDKMKQRLLEFAREAQVDIHCSFPTTEGATKGGVFLTYEDALKLISWARTDAVLSL